MTKIISSILVVISIMVLNSLFAQDSLESYSVRNRKAHQLLYDNLYHDAIKQLDQLIIDYPDIGSLYYNRGLSKYTLNDIIGAKKDLIKSKELGLKFNKRFVRYVTSPRYLVDVFSEGFFDEGELNADNDYKPLFGPKDSLQGSLRPERNCFDVYYYNLTIKVLPKTKSLEGLNQIFFVTKENTNKIQIDLSDNLDISYIEMNGKKLNYNRVYNAIFVSFDKKLLANEKYKITVAYSGKPKKAIDPPWNGGLVWKRKKHKHWVGVACEHLGASSWWPCKDHLSEKPDSMTINVQVPKKYQGISNGNLRATYEIDKKYTNYEWHVAYPINSYCVTFYMGNFVNFSEVYTNSNGSYDIDYYVLPHNLDKAKVYYSQTKDIIEVYEKLYGEYPYARDGIAMIEAPYEGMEHQSAIAIGGDYGKSKRRNYENKDYDYLVVHELAHEWWGNTVTMSDMADAWISEGFATYSEHLFMEEKFGYEEYLSASASNMEYIFNIWPVVGIKDVNDNTFFGGDIYQKGAAILNNLRCIINNDSLFFALINKFYNQNKFKTLDSWDFIDFVNSETGEDLSDFFNKFLYDKDPPILEYEYSLENGVLKFSYNWINVGNNFVMPFGLTINDTYNQRLVGTTKNKTIIFENVVSFSLPNRYMYDKELLSKNSFTYFWTNWKH